MVPKLYPSRPEGLRIDSLESRIYRETLFLIRVTYMAKYVHARLRSL